MSSWALVTGATAGIGESFTRLLAENNYNLVLVARDLPRLEERTLALQAKFGVETVVLQADLATEQGCALIENYLAEHDLDVLINNAGFGIKKAFTTSTLSDEQNLLDVLVRTPMRLMHVALPRMRARDKGIIINVSSVAGFIAGGTYSASKSYLTVLSESLNTELLGTKVRISALCPGFTRTEFHQRGRMSMKGLPNFMWLNADKLVSKAWSDALKGKAISIPSWRYQLLTFVMRYAPRSLVRKIGMRVRVKQRR
jgi:short-subunit dehydrogenase